MLLFYMDFGAIQQALYNTAFENKILTENFDAAITYLIEGKPYIGSYLGIHFSPILFSLVPVYMVLPYPYTIIIIKNILVVLSIVFLYKICLSFFSRKISLILTSIYAMHPGLHTLTIYDFQPQVFYPFLFFAFIYYHIKGDYKYAYIFYIFTLLVNEFYSILNLFFVITVALINRHKLKENRLIDMDKKRLFIYILLAIFFLVISHYIMASLKPRSLQPWSGVIGGDILGAVSYGFYEKMVYIGMILAPYGFIPARSLYSLALIPYFVLVLGSTHEGFYQFGWHYASYYLPILTISLIECFHGIRSKLNEETTMSSTSWPHYKKILYFSIVFFILLSPLNPMTLGNLPGGAYDPPPYSKDHVDKIFETLEEIPKNAVILVQTPISQLLANNPYAFTYPPDDNLDRFDYIIVDITHNDFKIYNFNSILLRAINEFNFNIYIYRDGIIVLKKNYKAGPIIYEPLEKEFRYMGLIPNIFRINSGNILLGYARPVLDLDSKNRLIIMLDGKYNRGNPYGWFGPYISLVPGKYSVFIKVKVDKSDNMDNGDILIDVAYDKGNVILAKKIVNIYSLGKDWNYIKIEFELDRLVTDLEIRGTIHGRFRLYVDYIYIKQESLYAHLLGNIYP